MTEADVMVVPSGMLRISKEGEADRVIYPVHADGWRQQGWAVHLPPPELDEEDIDREALNGEGLFSHPDDNGMPPDGAGDALSAAAEATGVPGADEESGPLAARLPVVVHPQTEAAEPEAALLPLERMTKAQIVAAVRERHGVLLDDSSTRAELLAQARQLETNAGGDDVRGDGIEGAGAGAAGHDTCPDNLAPAVAPAGADADPEAEAEAVVPALLI